MNIYQQFFERVETAENHLEKYVAIDLFVADLQKKRRPHFTVIAGRGKCELIKAVLLKHNISHEVTVLDSVAAIFEFK